MPTSTLKHAGTAAAICAANGWGVGTRLVGDEGYGPTVIEITAVGEAKLLAKCLGHNGLAYAPDESPWVLWCRDWREAADTDIPQPIPHGTSVRFACSDGNVEATVAYGPDARGGYRVEAAGRAWIVRGDQLEVMS